MRLKCLFVTVIVLLNFLCPSFAQEPVLFEHGGGVRTVEFSPVDASLIASAGESHTIKLWNLRNNTARTLSGHTGIVNSVAFSPNGESLASVSDDRTIKLWNVHNQQNIATLQDGTRFRSVSFSPNGLFLATGGARHVKLWDVRRRTEIATFHHTQDVRSVDFSSNGQLLAAGDGSGNGPGTVKVWDVQRRQIIADLEGDSKHISAVAFSPDDRYLASSGWDGQLKVWDVSNWDLLHTIQYTGAYDVAFSPDGKTLGNPNNGYVGLWSIENGDIIASLPGPAGWTSPIDFSPDGTFLAVGGEDGFVRLYNIEARLGSKQQGEMVRLIYFLPKSRQPQPDIDEKLDALIRDVQEFYADEMKHHGLGRKTFTFETNKAGKALVHHVDGQFTDSYYQEQTFVKVREELDDQFHTPQHIYLIAIDISSERLDLRACGEAKRVWAGGGEEIIIPASGDCFNVSVIAHELGHGFGLRHDFRNDSYIMSYGSNPDKISKCTAAWLDVNRFFNNSQNAFNKSSRINIGTTIQMLPPLETPPNAIRLRFKVNDSDGLHQAQLIIPTTAKDPLEGSRIKLHSCESLNGKSNILEFITTELTLNPATEVRLHVIDINGRITRQIFPIRANDIVRRGASRVTMVDAAGMAPETLQKISGDNQRGSPNVRLANPFVVAVRDADNEPVPGVQVTFRVTVGIGKLSITNPWTDSNGHAQTFLTSSGSQANRVEASISGTSERVTFSTDSQPEVLKGIIPDPNLAAALRSALSLGPNARITKQKMRELTELRAKNSRITDLTGLEHATRLRVLSLADNQISDLTPLAKLTQLNGISLFRNQIKNLTPLAKLTQLTWLDLGGNQIRNIAPLVSLTQLDWLSLWENKINNLRPLVGLTQLSRLDLRNNQISNLTPLAKLIQLRELQLHENQIRDVSPLAGLVNLETLYLKGNPIQDTSPLASLTKLRDVDVKITPPPSKDLIPAPNLAAAVRKALGLAPNARITKQKMRSLKVLKALKRQIKDITGLEHATQLTELELNNNRISDLTPLAGLTQLKRLSLSFNQVQDVSPLAGLTKLETLNLHRNQIRDVTPLAKLTQLEKLFLNDNDISDVSALVGLVNLEKLRLAGNPIQNTSPLTSLTKLRDVDIEITQPSVVDETPVVAATNAVLSISPSSVVSPAIGEQLTLNLSIVGGESIAGYQITLQFDATALRYVESNNGDYLPTGVSFVPPVVNRGSVELASTALTGVSNSDGTLATVTFEVLTVKASTLTLSDMLLADSQGNTFLPQVEAGEITEPPELKTDVTGDGMVNILDLVLVANALGADAPDLNGDGVVNVLDLVIVANAF